MEDDGEEVEEEGEQEEDEDRWRRRGRAKEERRGRAHADSSGMANVPSAPLLQKWDAERRGPGELSRGGLEPSRSYGTAEGLTQCCLAPIHHLADTCSCYNAKQ